MMTSSPKIHISFMGVDAFIRFSFRNGGHQAFFAKLQPTLTAAAWKVLTPITNLWRVSSFHGHFSLTEKAAGTGQDPKTRI